MCLLEVLRWIVFCGSEEEQQRPYRSSSGPSSNSALSHSLLSPKPTLSSVPSSNPCSSPFPSPNPALASSSSYLSSKKSSLSSSGPSSDSALSSSLLSPKHTLSPLPSSNPCSYHFPSSNPALSSSSHLSSKRSSLSLSGPSSNPALSSSLLSPKPTLSSNPCSSHFPSSNPALSSSSHLSSKRSSLSSSGPSSNSALSSSLLSPKPTLSPLPSSNPCSSHFPSSNPALSSSSHLSPKKPSLSSSGPSSNSALSSSLLSPKPTLSSNPCSSHFPSSNPALSSSSHLSSKRSSLFSSGPSSNSALSSSLLSPKPTLSSLPSSNPFASSASPSTLPFSCFSSSKPSTSSNASPTLHLLQSSWPQSPPSDASEGHRNASPIATVEVTGGRRDASPIAALAVTKGRLNVSQIATVEVTGGPLNVSQIAITGGPGRPLNLSQIAITRGPGRPLNLSQIATVEVTEGRRNISPIATLAVTKGRRDVSPIATVAVTEGGRNGQLERYEIPKHLEEQIKNDVVPEVLKRPLTPSTYAHYFAALLYAEDFYIEKWSKFLLSGVTLKLQSRKTSERFLRENKNANETILMNKKPLVSFEIDAIREKRPYLLSRDFVFLKGASKTEGTFKGVLFLVVKNTTVLVDFGDDFHSQHSPSKKYDVSFSFNRVCLKRSHQAISAAKDSSFHDVLFPTKPNTASSSLIANTIHFHRDLASRIVNHRGPAPYLIEGPLSLISDELSATGTALSSTSDKLSATGTAIQQAIKKIYWTSFECRILICAPANKSCDSLMRSLHSQIPRAKLFRANAAFREYDLVPGDIIPQSLYEGECFTCPSLYELQDFKVITSTYVSSFRLHTAGLKADHFTHIFLVDSSSAMEPEVVVPLTNFVGKNTVVVATGSSGDHPRWVRSDMAWRHGLKRSYFERLLEREPYLSRDPAFITHLE